MTHNQYYHSTSNYQNVYQQMGIPQPQPHLQYSPVKFSALNPPTSSFPNQLPPQQQQQPQLQQFTQPRQLPSPSRSPQVPIRSNSRPLPTPGKRETIEIPPKRRQNPPKFNPDPSSPTKQLSTTNSASSSPPKPPAISPSSSASTSNSTPDSLPPKKPIPVWKRTIPEVAPPVWGYAAGLVPDPHPKPSVPPPVQTTPRAPPGPESPTKSPAISNKLKKKNKPKDTSTSDDDAKHNKHRPNVPLHQNGLGYSSRRTQAQRYSASQYVAQSNQQYPFSRVSAIISGTANVERQVRELEDEDYEDEEEETETETEDDLTGHHTSDSGPTLSRFAHQDRHRTYYSQPLAQERRANGSKGGMHRREDGYHGYDYEDEDEEDDDTPKKRRSVTSMEKKIVLRPKLKVDPYGGYEDISPIGLGGRKKVRPRSDTEDGSVFRSVVATPRNARSLRRDEDDSEHFVQRFRKNNESSRPNHRRARSAIEEREFLVLNARRNRRNRRRNVEYDYESEEEEEEEEEKEEEVKLAYDEDPKVRRPGEDSIHRPRSQPNSGSRVMNVGGPHASGLPRPPMVREREGDGFPQERKIRGGPRSAFVHHVSEGEANENVGGGSWPGDLPRLPRTPGGGTNGRFISNEPRLNLDEPPPPPSIVRTPSPGTVNGYVFQERETDGQIRSQSAGFEQARRRFEVGSLAHGQVYASKVAYSTQPMAQSQAQQRQKVAHGPPPPAQGARFITSSPRKQRQTPAPPPTVGIESPYPLGGRDRMADMNKLEGSEGEAEERQEHLQGRRVSNVRNVPKIVMTGGNDDVASPRRNRPTTTAPDEPARRPLPSPSSSRTHPNFRPQSMVATHHGFGGPPTKSPARTPATIPAEAREIPRPRPSSVDINSNKNNNDVPAIQVFDVPGVYVSKPDFDEDHDEGGGGIMINVSGPGEDQKDPSPPQQRRPPSSQPAPNPAHSQYTPPSIYAGSYPPPAARGAATGAPSNRGLICGGCHGPITHGRILSAMGLRWHPPCFKCSVCNTLLEHVSSFEHDGKAYCHLDYHESFAPRCYSCETAIIDEQFISLDDPALGKRTYHTQHFFCSECGDPFLDPSIPLSTDANGELALSGDGEFEGFTVYKGYPYCEACHVRLRLPKCKRCKKSIRDHEEAVEALGGKWCWSCFVCAGCSKPFENPSFFQRGNQPYCEDCFSMMLRNEI